MSTLLRTLVVSAVTAGLASTASAGQRTDDPLANPSGSASSPTIQGWALTPSLGLSRIIDDNVLVHGPGDPQVRDAITAINPRTDVQFNGPRAQFSAQYDGWF